MTREEAKEFLPILQAYADGKTIQYHIIEDGYWYDVTESDDLDPTAFEYRIKPESDYRPFKNVDECWNEMLKHKPFGWIKGEFGEYATIDFIDFCGTARHSRATWDFEKSFSYIRFADGCVFGVKKGGEE